MNEMDRLFYQIELNKKELMEGISGIHHRLDTLNGRTNQNVTDIAVLKDRESRDPSARWGAGIGILVAILSVLWEVFKG